MVAMHIKQDRFKPVSETDGLIDWSNGSIENICYPWLASFNLAGFSPSRLRQVSQSLKSNK